MKRTLLLLTLLSSLCAPLAFAQDGQGPAEAVAPGGATAEASAGTASTDGASEAAPAKAPGEPSAAWKGPRVALSYRLYSLRDSTGGRSVQTVAFSGFLPVRYLYAGGGVEIGGRRYLYGSTDGLFSGNLFAGYQRPMPLRRGVSISPYGAGIGELGLVWGQRFHTPLSHGFRGLGLEIGANVNLVKTLWAGLGLSFMAYSMDRLSYNTFGLRLSIGL